MLQCDKATSPLHRHGGFVWTCRLALTLVLSFLPPTGWLQESRRQAASNIVAIVFDRVQSMSLQLIPGLSRMFKTTSLGRVPSNETVDTSLSVIGSRDPGDAGFFGGQAGFAIPVETRPYQNTHGASAIGLDKKPKIRPKAVQGGVGPQPQSETVPSSSDATTKGASTKRTGVYRGSPGRRVSRPNTMRRRGSAKPIAPKGALRGDSGRKMRLPRRQPLALACRNS
ncbi:hypothetical protein CDD80_5952 [Ophiocordyceps camponoti-rufipedis]|uniref:Uncharacterized protein n=1 Tax=Ophiocordyceps camponoti-rufipedis TaxID=2004952 RepID=A0A2C5XXC3_9HYPO|nr:hypothetical protein CDD80_5952 [Ophiocordyceps camponoti-rufipedis]